MLHRNQTTNPQTLNLLLFHDKVDIMVEQTVIIYFQFDCCPSEISWEIRDSSEKIISQKRYTEAIPPYGQAEERIDLEGDLDYYLIVFDHAGDGFEENAGNPPLLNDIFCSLQGPRQAHFQLRF